MGAALLTLVSTPAGATLFGLLLIVPSIAGAVLICAIFWERIASTRGRTFDAHGRCTCRQVEDARAETRELYRQEKALQLAFRDGVPLDGADITGFRGQGVGR